MSKAAFTVITSNYISYAKTLGDSIKKYNPDYAFFVCLIDDNQQLLKEVDVSDFEIIKIEELNNQSVITGMQAHYNLFELSCALKPFFADHLLKYKNVSKRLKYFDSDMMLFGAFDNEWENHEGSIFLTPHFFTPVGLFDDNINDIALLRLGIYNAGYFEVANNTTVFQFLDWWKNYLAEYCFDRKSPFKHIFVDQSWLDLVPLYFDGTYLVKNLGYNVSFYNLHERKISMRDGTFLINDNVPLVFFHYTGYSYYKHQAGSRNHPRYNYQNTPYLEDICNQYRAELIKNNIKIILPPPSEFQHREKRIVKIKIWIFSSLNSMLSKYFKLKLSKED